MDRGSKQTKMVPGLAWITLVSMIVCMLCFSSGYAAETKENHPRKKKLSKIELSPRIGYLYQGKYRLQYTPKGPGTDPVNTAPGLIVDDRHGWLLNFGIKRGGSGYIFDFTPYFSLSHCDELSVIAGLGAYFGTAYRWVFGHWVISAGLGPKLGVILSDKILYGGELFFRLPLSGTWYPSLSKNWAVVYEISILYGATGIKAPNLPQPIDSFKFGHHWALDSTIGIEWP